MALAFGRIEQAVVLGISLMLSPLGFIATYVHRQSTVACLLCRSFLTDRL